MNLRKTSGTSSQLGSPSKLTILRARWWQKRHFYRTRRPIFSQIEPLHCTRSRSHSPHRESYKHRPWLIPSRLSSSTQERERRVVRPICVIYTSPSPVFLSSSISVSRSPSNFHSPSLSSFYRSLFLDCPVIFAVRNKLNIPKRESARKREKNIKCQNQLFLCLSLSLSLFRAS